MHCQYSFCASGMCHLKEQKGRLQKVSLCQLQPAVTIVVLPVISVMKIIAVIFWLSSLNLDCPILCVPVKSVFLPQTYRKSYIEHNINFQISNYLHVILVHLCVFSSQVSFLAILYSCGVAQGCYVLLTLFISGLFSASSTLVLMTLPCTFQHHSPDQFHNSNY